MAYSTDLEARIAKKVTRAIVDYQMIADGDRVQLDPGTQYTVAQVGGDTVVSMTGGGQLVLVGVQMSSLTGTWIFGN